jgi:hypothetical protein
MLASPLESESFATHQGSSGQEFSLRISLVTRLDGGQIAGGAFTSPFSIDLSRAITPHRAVCCVEACAEHFRAYACLMPGWALPHTVRRIPSSHPCCVPLRRAWRLFRRVPPAFTSCVAFPLCKHDWHSTRLTIAVIVVIMCVSSFAVRPPTSRVGALSSSSSSFVGGLCGGNTSGMSLRRRSFDFARSTDACRGRRRLVFLCGLRSLVHIYIIIAN